MYKNGLMIKLLNKVYFKNIIKLFTKCLKFYCKQLLHYIYYFFLVFLILLKKKFQKLLTSIHFCHISELIF
jgi:hypothetical protein